MKTVTSGTYYDIAWCGSPNNPSTKKSGLTQKGTDFNICAEGRTVEGRTYTDCKFYTRTKTQKPSKRELKRINRLTIIQRMHETDKKMLILLIIVVLLALASSR